MVMRADVARLFLACLIAAASPKTACASTGLEQASVPRVELSVVDRRDKYPVTREIRVEGDVTQELIPAHMPAFEWSVFEAESHVPLDVSVMSTRGLSPSLVILPNVLQPSKAYSVRLVATLPFGSAEATMSAEMRIETAGAPSSGSLEVSPSNGTSAMRRIFSAQGWSAEDMPLTYTFGYFDGLGHRTYLHAPPLTVYGMTSRLGEAGWSAVPTETPELLEIDELPVGDPLADYVLIVFVDVCTPYGACSIARREIQSSPVNGSATSSNQPPAIRGRMARSTASSVQLQAHPQPLLFAALSMFLCAASSTAALA